MVVNKDITWEGNVYQVNGNGVCSGKSNGTGHNVSDNYEIGRASCRERV